MGRAQFSCVSAPGPPLEQGAGRSFGPKVLLAVSKSRVFRMGRAQFSCGSAPGPPLERGAGRSFSPKVLLAVSKSRVFRMGRAQFQPQGAPGPSPPNLISGTFFPFLFPEALSRLCSGTWCIRFVTMVATARRKRAASSSSAKRLDSSSLTSWSPGCGDALVETVTKNFLTKVVTR